MSAPRIVICDDEPDLREMVGEYLSARAFNVEMVGDVRSLKAAVDAAPVDLVILDVRMPGEDGLSALRRLRAESDLPIVMLTAADGVIDRILGLEMGADDYVGKPVDLRELEARVKAVLRRRASSVVSVAEEKKIQRFGPWTLDLDAARLSGEHGDVTITAMEFALLKVFAENRGRVLSRDQLLDLAHHRGWEPFDRSIDLRISRLRRKIESNPAKPRYIKTVRGLGYVFSDDAQSGGPKRTAY